jgi:hypothetical protein
MAFFHIDAEFSDELLAKLPQPLERMKWAPPLAHHADDLLSPV